MRKIKLEKLTGVVALSYLVLIPVGGYFAWRRIKVIDADVTAVWSHLRLDQPAEESQPRRPLRYHGPSRPGKPFDPEESINAQ